MTDKERVKKILANVSKFLQALEKSRDVVQFLYDHAVKHELHDRAINSRKALDGLINLIDDLQSAQSLCLEVLGAKKVPIDNQDKPKLKLVVDNERRKS